MEIAKIETIDGLYKAYHDDVTPLLAYVESELAEFPIAILNEIRSLHDHIARACLSKSIEAKCKEIESARRHIVRIKLDCCKVLCVLGESRMEEFHKNYRKIRLGEVDNGNFLPELTQLHDKARKLVQSAKEAEKSGKDGQEETVTLFQEAVISYKLVEQFIERKSKELAWSASRQRRYFWSSLLISFFIGVVIGYISIGMSSHLIGLLIGVATGCISTWIMHKILK